MRTPREQILQLHNGDCFEVLKGLADNSIDAVVTDPPYGLNSKEPDMAEVLKHWLAGDDAPVKGSGFMGKAWDRFVPGPAVWREVFRVLKPGGHLLSFFGSRTYDMGTLAIRLAGFEIRDQIMWVYGSGFPKSLNVEKATGEDAWSGWGTALKPAHEPICVARKPLAGTVAANVLAHGTGGLNIDGCRAPTGDKLGGGHSSAGQQMGGGWERPWMADPEAVAANIERSKQSVARSEELGRWPANLVHDGSDEVLAAFPDAKGQQGDLQATGKPRLSSGRFGDMAPPLPHKARSDTSKSAARFFYCAKASKADRNYGLSGEDISSAELVGREDGSAGVQSPRAGAGRTTGSKNPHPTVKPVALMRWLVRLVTPPGGRVLDPFMGSGSTGVATALEGFRFTGIELDPQFFAVASERIYFARKEYISEIKQDEPAEQPPAEV